MWDSDPSASAELGSEHADFRHLPEQLGIEGEHSSGSVEVSVPRAEAKSSLPVHPPRPPTPRPKAPSGTRTPVPPPGRSAYRDVVSARASSLLVPSEPESPIVQCLRHPLLHRQLLPRLVYLHLALPASAPKQKARPKLRAKAEASPSLVAPLPR